MKYEVDYEGASFEDELGLEIALSSKRESFESEHDPTVKTLKIIVLQGKNSEGSLQGRVGEDFNYFFRFPPISGGIFPVIIRISKVRYKLDKAIKHRGVISSFL